MSTRCNIHFSYGNKVEANIYRHSDGYPDTDNGVLHDLKKFFKDVEEQTRAGATGSGTRFSDPAYLAAKFVVWQANANVQGHNEMTERMKRSMAGFVDYKNAGGILDFLSIGIVKTDAADCEFVYNVDCTKLDAKGRPTVTYRSR